MPQSTGSSYAERSSTLHANQKPTKSRALCEAGSTAIKNWNWKQVHDELMQKYSDIDENKFYRFNYGRWDLVKPDGERKKVKSNPIKTNNPLTIEIKNNGGSGITIPIRLILTVEFQTKGIT